jgi:hypothetical protein
MKLGTIAVALVVVGCGKSHAKPDAAPAAARPDHGKPSGLPLSPVTRRAGSFTVTARVPSGWREDVGDPTTDAFSDPTPGVKLASTVILRAGCVGPCDHGNVQSVDSARTWQITQHEAAGFQRVEIESTTVRPDDGFEVELTFDIGGVGAYQYIRQLQRPDWPTPATCVAIATGEMTAHRADLRASCESFSASLVLP